MAEGSISTGREVTPATSKTPIAKPDLPPHPLDATWYMRVEAESYGPFDGHSLKALVRDGRLTPDTDVIREGSEIWLPAADDPALRSLFAPGRPPLPQAYGTADLPHGKVTAGEGATVVQVTNNLPPPQPQTIIVDGTAKPKSAGLAFFLSFLIVGLGQFYNGDYGKGILMMIGCVLLWLVMLGWIVMIWSWVDAYQTAKAMNDRYQRRLAAGIA